MTPKIAGYILVLASLALVVTIYIVYWYVIGEVKPPKNPVADSMAALAFITSTAVGIERTIEGLWTVLGGVLGSYWPLNALNRQVKTLTDELDNSLKPFHEQALAGIKTAKERADQLPEVKKKLQDAENDIGRLKKRFDELRNLSPGNQRAQLLAAAASQNVNYLKEKYGDVLKELNDAATVAKSAIDGLQDFVASFKDNPGRRLISIYLGSIVGLIIAGLFQLDIFKAAGANTDNYMKVSIILTGIVIGLGSQPTHEIIRVIQEFKEGRKGANAKQPELPPEKTT